MKQKQKQNLSLEANPEDSFMMGVELTQLAQTPQTLPSWMLGVLEGLSS